MSSGIRIQNPEMKLVQHSAFQDLLNSLPAAIYLCDADGFVTVYNEAAVDLWGRRPDVGKDLWCGSWKTYNPDGTPLPLDKCPMALALKTRQAVMGHEIIIERPDGERLNVLPHPQPIFDEKGTFTGAINMLVDITKQKEAREVQLQRDDLSRLVQELRKSEERYHSMISEVEDYAILRLSLDGTVENWNKGAQKIKGYSEQEIIGRNFRIFYPPEDQENHLPDRLLHEATTKGKAQHEGWRVRKDGSRFWGSISITALHDTDGKVIGFSKVTRDLTARRNSELKAEQHTRDLQLKNEQLRQSEDRYHRMISEVEDYVIILLSPKGIIENWNKGAEKIKGYTANEIVGKHFSIFYSAEDRSKRVPDKLLEEAQKNGRALHEGWRLKKDGTTFWGSVVMTSLHNDDGELIGFTKVTRDLTEKKITEDRLIATSLKLEEKNKELQRMNEELSSFAYISSHDLQEPLRKIQTFADRIMDLEYKNLSEKGRDYFQRMLRGAARMQKLIRDILAYSRTTTSEKTFEPTDLNEVLAQSRNELEVMILEKKAVIQNTPLPVLKVIPFQMQQLFNNLINNSLKFSQDGSPPQIFIRAELVDAESLDVPYTGLAKKYCHLIFEDRGIGFEPMYAKKIFEVFQRLHGRSEYGGTGIGLAICKKIVENHRGMIWAEGKPHQGATFHVYLPAIS